MSERMSLDHARAIAEGYGATTVNETRAARTIVKMGEVLDKVREEWTKLDDDLTMMRNGDQYEEGILDTLDRVETWLEETLGDPNE